jgi:hypothetical protein
MFPIGVATMYRIPEDAIYLLFSGCLLAQRWNKDVKMPFFGENRYTRVNTMVAVKTMAAPDATLA